MSGINVNTYPNREKEYEQNVNISNEIFGNRFHIKENYIKKLKMLNTLEK